MSFNTEALTLLTLGIRGDQPFGSERPALPDGNHCRWFPDQDLGFPWHGFYLFRRESRPSRPRCLSAELRHLRPGTSQSIRLETTLGRLSSAKPLVFTEDFLPAGLVEVDLAQGASLRFDLPGGVEARRVDVRIGLRDAGAPRSCVDFRRLPLGLGPNPRTEKEAVFTTEPPPISGAIDATSIEQWPGSPPGLQTSRRLEIALPCPATRIDLLLSNRGELKIEALDADGRSVAVQNVAPLALTAGTVSLTGKAITQVTLESSIGDPALLHEICFECPAAVLAAPGKGARIEVRALAGTAAVASTVVQGNAGEVVAATLEGTGITAVELAPGPGALVDLCVWTSAQGVTFGWEEVPGFRYPLCLPVAHPDYPCAGKPATFDDAKALALSRVTYPAPQGWDQGFAELHGELTLLVQGGPGGVPMAQRVHPDLPGQPLSPATQSDVPKLPGLRPLDLVFLASLHPAMAQMLGLYFADTSVPASVGYDYLLLADPTGVLGGSAETALAWLAFTADSSQVDATLVLGRRPTPRPPIDPPGAPRAYALPGMATRAIDGTVPETAGNVGLWWPLPADSTDEQPDQIVFYYPQRVSLGPIEPTAQPAVAQYQPLPHFAPVLVSEPDPLAVPGPRSSDWPPPSIPLHVVDANLPEGWYSYRVAGDDLFGRRSALGPPSQWFEWEPTEHQRHPYAVALLDKVPPPPPLGVEAWALDPLDRWVLVDEPHETWRADVGDTLVGLRVRWRWTLLQQVQAPDMAEFRIYYQPGRWNALLGKIEQVAAASAFESDVDLDVADSHPPNTFAGARLRVGNEDFGILGSQPGAKLRLRVKNLGVDDEVRPAEGKPCTVAIPEKHALWVDTSFATTWAKRLAVVDYDPPARTVVDPVEDANGRLLTDAAFTAASESAGVTVSGTIAQLPPMADLSGVQPWIDHLWLEDATEARETHRIVRYDAAARTVELETPPALGPPVHWILGRPTREYDVFLPAPDVGAGKPFEPSLAEPAVYAQIAVSAADDKQHAADDPKWNDPARFGNESRLSPSATVFRVLQTPPQAPELPDLGDRLWATPADYYDRSYSTFRFKDPKEPLRVHILRALDDSLFKRDWLIRETRKLLDPVLDPAALGAKIEHLAFFPDGWDFSQRKAAADGVNALAQGAAYSSLSNDAWTVLALLPGNESQANRTALEQRDVEMRRLRGKLVAADADLSPQSWTAATHLDAAKSLNDLADPPGYLALPDSALRLLAALPGNEVAFTQVTLQPFDMADPEIQDQRRPDDAESYTPDPTTLRAYTDTLPGRATNRYFYRASFVDGAQNPSALSLPGPPVYLRKVEPPRTPVITRIEGGDRQITVAWAANREVELVEYRVYRATTKEAARDLRLMTLVATHGPTERSWVDTSAPLAMTVYYRLAAVDSAGNVSSPSRSASARAFDDSEAPVPVWKPPTVEPGGTAVALSWELPSADLRAVVFRRSSADTAWENLTGWLPEETATFKDSGGSGPRVYRLVVMDGEGRVAKAAPDLTVDPTIETTGS